MKKFSLSMILILTLGLLVGCGGTDYDTEELEADTESMYIAKTQEVIESLSEGGFAAIDSELSPEMKEEITPEVEEQVNTDLEKLGQLIEFQEGEGIRYIHKETGEISMSFQQQAVYENEEPTFTVNYNEAGEIIGLFYK